MDRPHPDRGYELTMIAESGLNHRVSEAQPRASALTGLRTVLYGLVLVAGVAVPLLFSPRLYNAFELPKAALSRGLAGLALLTLAYTPRPGGLRRWLSQPLVALVLTLAGTLVTATIFSVDPRLSLWGSYDRQFGLLTWLAPLALFLAALTALQTPERRHRLAQVLVWSSTFTILYGLVQALGADPFAWESDGASVVMGTLGRSNFLAAYLVMIIPLTLGELWSANRRWPLVGLLVAQVVVLTLTRARAAWLGVLAAALTFGLLWIHMNGRRRLAGRVVLLGTALGVLLMGLAAFSVLPARLTAAGSSAARLTIWQATAPLLAARPLLGYGPDTMSLVFQEVFPPELVYYQGRHLAVDRAHNLWLDLGMSAGVLGVAAFGGVLVGVGRRIRGRLHAAGDPHRRVADIVLSAAIVGHLVELQLSFETVGTAVVFWLLLALAGAGAGRSVRSSAAAVEAPPPSSQARRWTSLPLALPFVALLGMLTVRPLLADGAYWRARRTEPASMAALRHFEGATQRWSIEPRYHLALGQAYWVNGQPAAAVNEAVTAARLRPSDARLWAALGDLYARWGATDRARYAQALAAYRRTVALAPNTAAYHTALGLVLAESGRLEEGIRAIEGAVALDATDPVAYTHLARLYDAADRTELAGWAATQARRWSTGGDD